MSLKDLIADVNVNEICEHIETETLSEWVNAWQETAISALRPVSREQVEKVWTAEWTVDEFGHKCSKCGEYLPDGEDVRKPQFCPECGRAMTDEAMQMVMKKLEVLHNGKSPLLRPVRKVD